MVVKPHSRNWEGKDDINWKNFKRTKRATFWNKKAWCCIFQGFEEGIKKVIAKFYKKRKNLNYCRVRCTTNLFGSTYQTLFHWAEWLQCLGEENMKNLIPDFVAFFLSHCHCLCSCTKSPFSGGILRGKNFRFIIRFKIAMLEKKSTCSPGQEDLLARQVTARGRASHPLKKSWTKMSKGWPRASKLRELLTQRTSWNSSFFEPNISGNRLFSLWFHKMKLSLNDTCAIIFHWDSVKLG